MCLLCEKTFTNEAMKPSRLIEHLKRNHSEKMNKDLNFFKELRDKRKRQVTVKTMFSTACQQNDGLLASYNISLMIAKSGKPHTIGEDLIVPAIRKVLKTVLHKDPESVLKAIPLSNSTVQRRIDEMAENVKDRLCALLQSKAFSLQIDEATLPDNSSLLLAYVRYLDEGKLHQELLFASTLDTYTKGQSIFATVEDFFRNKNIPLTNILTCTPDGAPSMMGQHNGFISLLKTAAPKVISIHCVIHRQHLAAKPLSGKLNVSLKVVISVVNKIKSHALNSRLFRQLCSENDEDYDRLLLHTEVRWLSKGNCLSRVFTLFDTVVEFLETVDESLHRKILEIKHDVA